MSMGHEFYFRDKIDVAVLGATGSVGQRFVELLANHPWFQLVAVAASERSTGKRYKDVANWIMSTPMPEEIGDLEVLPCEPSIPCSIVFSALDSSVASAIETNFAQAGYIVISNASNHRMDPTVPLLIPEVNESHLDLLSVQPFPKGKIITNPNCSAIGLCIALKPLQEQFGIESVQITTMQAVSGAGYPGVPSLDILDNLLPYIPNEEEKLESEPLKILGVYQTDKVIPAQISISAQCNRVAVTDGHTASISLKLHKKASIDEIINAWEKFSGTPQNLHLPLAPEHPIHYLTHKNAPQPRLHRNRDKGMAIFIGRLRPCPILDYKFTILSHNTIRGAAGGAILCAELLTRKGKIFW